MLKIKKKQKKEIDSSLGCRVNFGHKVWIFAHVPVSISAVKFYLAIHADDHDDNDGREGNDGDREMGISA